MKELRSLKSISEDWKKCKNSSDRKELIKRLWKQYKSIFWYLVFGVLTTLVNIVAYIICMQVFSIGNIASNIVAWVLAVLFAYLTNRKWVFVSAHHTKKEISLEIINFFLARGGTGLLDLLIMWTTVDLLHFPSVIMKVIANIIVIILNYLASKLWVFGTHKKSQK